MGSRGVEECGLAAGRHRIDLKRGRTIERDADDALDHDRFPLGVHDRDPDCLIVPVDVALTAMR